MEHVPTLIHHRVKPSPACHKSYRIVLIPGNPGVIAYYEPFLQGLKTTLLDFPIKAKAPCKFDIYGRSLFGFEATRGFKATHASEDPNDPAGNACSPSITDTHYPLSLNNQIDHVQSFLESLVPQPRPMNDDLGLILIGHSVGAFILLHILQQFSLLHKGKPEFPRIVGAICLFPTVVHIAKSPTGRKVAWLLKLPCFALIVSMLVKLLVSVLSTQVLTRIVARLTNFPNHATHATVALLQSPHGVLQALSMAKDEMKQIVADGWGEEIWGSPTYQPSTRFFYFGSKDHWVAEETRDGVIAMRSSMNRDDDRWKPRMEIDKLHIPHGFCISQSPYDSRN